MPLVDFQNAKMVVIVHFIWIHHCFEDMNFADLPSQTSLEVPPPTEMFLLDCYSCKMALHTPDSLVNPLVFLQRLFN